MRMRYDAAHQPGIITSLGGLVVAIACFLTPPQAAYAQKGMGDPTGMARQGLQPPLTKLAGKVLSIETHPCEKTTGRAVVGTHLILEAADGRQYNLHVGPADAVASIVESLEPRTPIEVVGFRTSKLPENQYVATRLTLADGTVVRLRDSSLRPFWAGQGRRAMGRNQGFAGPRRGWGRGRHWRSRSAYGSCRWHRGGRRSGRCRYE